MRHQFVFFASIVAMLGHGDARSVFGVESVASENAITRNIEPTDSRNTATLLFPIARSRRVLRDLRSQESDLLTEETRQKNRRQSYNYKSPPRKHQYQNHNRHSDGKQGKGGYHKSDSYQGNRGHSDYTSYNKANKDSYGDSDHKQFGHKDGGKYGGGKSGGNKYGGGGGHSTGGHGGSGGQYASEYSDNSQDYLGAGGF
jgi:hypothetical protein